MALILRQSSAVDVLIGPFVDLTNGSTSETGESPTVKLSKNGQGLAAKNDATTPVHDADGYYNCELDATDTNTPGTLVLTVAASANALPVRHEFQVIEEAVYDAMWELSSAGPLQSTTAGRTLDVTATGAAGIDWGNVENPTTAVDLSGTDIQLCDTVTTNTDLVTAASTADAVWDELTSAHTTSGSYGQRLFTLDEGTAAAAAATTITLEAGANATDDFYNNSLIVITAGTGAEQARFITDYVGSTRVATVDTWVTTPSTDSVYYIMPFSTLPGASAPTAAQVADAVWDEAVADHTGGTTFGGTDAAILVDTNSLNDTKIPNTLNTTASGNIGIDWANVENPTTALDLSGTDIQLVDTTTTNTDMLTLADIADEVWDEVLTSGTHNVGNSAGRRLRQIEAGIDIHQGTAQAGAARTITLDTGASAIDDFYIHQLVIIEEGTGVGQVRVIWTYDGTTKVATVARPWSTNPDATSVFVVSPGVMHGETDHTIVDLGVVQAATANSVTLATTASATDGLYDPGTIEIIEGTGAGQQRFIIGYNGTTKVAQIDKDWRTNPDTTSLYQIVGQPQAMHVNEGFAQAGAAGTITLNSAASAVNDTYIGQLVFIKSGTGQDQARIITAYNGTTKVATILPVWSTNPDATSGYVMLPSGISLADVYRISGDTTAADNAELFFDGTGYAGGTTPLDVNISQISGDSTAADNLEGSTETLVLGSAITGTLTTTTFTTDLTEATDDHYIGRTVIFRTGVLAGQGSDITDYTGSTKLVTVTAMTEAPSNGDTFVIV